MRFEIEFTPFVSCDDLHHPCDYTRGGNSYSFGNLPAANARLKEPHVPNRDGKKPGRLVLGNSDVAIAPSLNLGTTHHDQLEVQMPVCHDIAIQVVIR